MCGIVGFLAKNPSLEGRLGTLLAPMLEGMGERGPDSAGFAVFERTPDSPPLRISLLAEEDQPDWDTVAAAVARQTGSTSYRLDRCGRHAVLVIDGEAAAIERCLAADHPELLVLSIGRSMDVYKDVGTPEAVARRYHLHEREGSHAIGHTRMATESAITPRHAHPFVAGEDFCIVHNGSLSNPYSVRRALERRGIRFETDNDTEAAARFVQWRLGEGDDLNDALKRALLELDGFFTLLMANRRQLALVRDPFACKPAVVAETDDYVAIASEFRSLKHLPGIRDAEIFEPYPEEVYVWNA